MVSTLLGSPQGWSSLPVKGGGRDALIAARYYGLDGLGGETSTA
jgi:hypothetical protein